jgi:hypothetical protein
MNEREMNEALDGRLARLPREIAPRRDLWPAIAQRLHDAGDGAAAPAARRSAANGWRQLAAAVVLAALSSLTTYAVMRQQSPAPERSAAARLVQEELGAARFLPAGYAETRRELSAAFEDSLARLSPQTRRVVETNLHDIERSLAEIGAALARDPGNARLQQLLLAASEQELAYLDEVRRLALSVPGAGA